MITLNAAIGPHLDPAHLSQLQLTLTIAPPPDPSIPECLPRTSFPALLDLINAQIGVEVGVQRGEFSAYLLANWPGQLYLVDPWQHQPEGYHDWSNVPDEQHGANYQATLTAMAPFEGRYNIIRGFSACAAGFFDDGALDFVYLDGNHSYEAVSCDLAAWYPRLRPGGLMAGHDFIDLDRPGLTIRVKSAVLDFVVEKGHKVYGSREPWPSLWYCVKK